MNFEFVPSFPCPTPVQLQLLIRCNNPPGAASSSTPAHDSMQYFSWHCKLSCPERWFAKTASFEEENEGNIVMHTLNQVLVDKESADGKCWTGTDKYRCNSIFQPLIDRRR